MSTTSIRISIFGLGYVGCVSGACLASLGHRVIGVEPNPTKLDLINAGRSPVVEKDLSTLIERQVIKGGYRATNDWESAIAETDMALVCVGTPSRANGSIKLDYVTRVCQQIGESLRTRNDYFTVVIRSTVLPGTVEEVLIPILETGSGKRAGRDFGVCMNPEFLREGSAIEDFFHPPKTIIGQLDERSGECLLALYRDLPAEIRRVPIRVAEMVKYTDNAFHALKVVFANEIGTISKAMQIDSRIVMDVFCLDTKLNLSPYYLKPGFAFGGSCLPKDLRALNYLARSMDLETPTLSSVLTSNRRHVEAVVQRLLEYKGKTLGFIGMSFKSGTDDLRESPLVELMETMIGKGFDVRVFDPYVSLARLTGANKDFIEKEIPHISKLMCNSVEEVFDRADVIVLGHNGSDARSALSWVSSRHVIFDLVRGCQDGCPEAGEYHGISW